jgi:hypothetical protein
MVEHEELNRLDFFLGSAQPAHHRGGDLITNLRMVASSSLPNVMQQQRETNQRWFFYAAP